MTQTPSEYAALVSAMLRRAAVSRQPAHGSFELTSRCNLSCRMCYVRQAAGDMTKAAKELSASAWLELARQATDNGMVFLLLTGGEIFLRRDFFEIYEPLTRMGLSIALFTNGTLITKDIAARLAQAPPSRAEITLYGATSATCEAVTGRPGSFAACCNGIEALLENRITFSLKTTVTRQNVGELEAMRQMAHDWGVPFSASWLLTRRPDLTVSEVEDCRLSAEECIALEATDSASADEWTEAALRQTAEGRHGNFYCQAGKAAFAINPAGEMNACLLLPYPAALPLQTGFPDAWKVVQQYVDSAPPAGAECRDCDAFQYCGRCPAWSLVEKGTLTDAVPYLCEIARARRNHYEKPA
ncbi:MAG: radical SAM protein [Syntrophobacteraceae bacterium]